MLIKVGCGGVDLSSLHPRMWDAIKAWKKAFPHLEIIITSTWEGTHLDYSKHYQKQALDFRRPKALTDNEILYELRMFIGGDFDVVVEKDHVHIEYDPK